MTETRPSLNFAINAVATQHVDLSRPVYKIDGTWVTRNFWVLLTAQKDSSANGIYIAERRGLRRRFFLRRTELKSVPGDIWRAKHGVVNIGHRFVHIYGDVFGQFFEMPENSEDWS